MCLSLLLPLLLTLASASSLLLSIENALFAVELLVLGEEVHDIFPHVFDVIGIAFTLSDVVYNYT